MTKIGFKLAEDREKLTEDREQEEITSIEDLFPALQDVLDNIYDRALNPTPEILAEEQTIFWATVFGTLMKRNDC